MCEDRQNIEMYSDAESGVPIAIYDGLGQIRDLRSGGWSARIELFEEVDGQYVSVDLLTTGNSRVNFLDPDPDPKATLYLVFNTAHMSSYNFNYATGDLYISQGAESEPPIELGFIMRRSLG